MTPEEIRTEIARCDREIAAMQAQNPVKPAYLTTLGIEDWKRERAILEDMLGYRIDPKTGIKPIADWGNACYRGFVSDSRFGSGQVIKRTNRETTRKWIRNSRPRAS